MGKVFLVATAQGIVSFHFFIHPIAEHLTAVEKKLKKRPVNNDTIMQTHWEKLKNQAPLTLILSGTHFQQKVWQGLMAIPPGTTLSYQRVAKNLGIPRATRAVANAIGANDLAYLIPCHRVIRSDKTLGGYQWGLKVKKALLKAEKMNPKSTIFHA